MTPAVYNFSIVRGTTQPFVFTLRTRASDSDPWEALPFEDVRLNIWHKNTFLYRKTFIENSDEDDEVPGLLKNPGGIEVIDEYAGQFRWTPTPAESRALPKFDPAKPYTPPNYEIEVWNNGSQLVYMIGDITATGGANDD